MLKKLFSFSNLLWILIILAILFFLFFVYETYFVVKESFFAKKAGDSCKAG